MYHPAAALRSTGVERESYEDIAVVPTTLLRARESRAQHELTDAAGGVAEPVAPATPESALAAPAMADAVVVGIDVGVEARTVEDLGSAALASATAGTPDDPPTDQLTLF
jgi:hypothetical protein